MDETVVVRDWMLDFYFRKHRSDLAEFSLTEIKQLLIDMASECGLFTNVSKETVEFAAKIAMLYIAPKH